MELNEVYGIVWIYVELSWVDVELNSFWVMDDVKCIKFYGKVRIVVYLFFEILRILFDDYKCVEVN